MIHEWERQYTGRIDNIFHAMGHVVPWHLMDKRLHPFETLRPTGVPDAMGDRAFDDDDEPCAPAASAAGVAIKLAAGMKD